MPNYNYKIEQHLFPIIENFKNPTIVEFGVENGRSTKKFLKICDRNDGRLISVDIKDCSKVSRNKKWTFIQSRDDNFMLLNKILPKKVDVFFLDSLHEADHVEKIFFQYYDRLNVGGFFFIDDISPLPYLKNSKRNSFYCEINNIETKNRILEIYNNNKDLFDLSFSYISSGLAIIKKNKKKKLNNKSKIISRTCSIKNFLRVIWKFIRKN